MSSDSAPSISPLAAQDPAGEREPLSEDDREALDYLARAKPFDAGHITFRLSPVLRDHILAALSPALGSSGLEGEQGVLVHTQAGTDSLCGLREGPESEDVRPPIDHDIKCWPEYFQAIRSGDKPFEVRRNDRDYRAGDTLVIREWDPGNAYYTGEAERRRISYVLSNAMLFGLAPGYAVLGLAALSSQPRTGVRDEPAYEHKDLAPKAGGEGGEPLPECLVCRAVNADPRVWDVREPICPACQDSTNVEALPPPNPLGTEGGKP